MELTPKELKFGKTTLIYYAYFILLFAFQLGALIVIKDIGLRHPFWRDPRVQAAMLKMAAILLLVPPVLAAFAVFRRRRACRRRWILVPEGVQVFRDGILHATHPWGDMMLAAYRRKGAVVEISVRGKFWPVSLPGVDRDTGTEFVSLVKKGLKLTREVQQQPGA